MKQPLGSQSPPRSAQSLRDCLTRPHALGAAQGRREISRRISGAGEQRPTRRAILAQGQRARSALPAFSSSISVAWYKSKNCAQLLLYRLLSRAILFFFWLRRRQNFAIFSRSAQDSQSQYSLVTGLVRPRSARLCIESSSYKARLASSPFRSSQPIRPSYRYPTQDHCHPSFRLFGPLHCISSQQRFRHLHRNHQRLPFAGCSLSATSLFQDGQSRHRQSHPAYLFASV